jgi:DNA-directed RNA polymerase specialized sigma24 family protein
MGIVVGVPREGQEACCTVCLARELRTETILTDREAEVAAHQQLTGAALDTIAERTGIPEGAVAKASQGIELKLTQVERLGRGGGDA